MNFDFLNNIQAVEVQQEVKVRTGREKIQRNPEGLSIRFWQDGSVYPSQELVDTYDLEYRNKNDEHQGNGFDIIDSREWVQFPKEVEQHLLMIAVVSKKAPKVDLFGETVYNKDMEQSPKSSVIDQATKRPEIIEKLQELYGIEFTEDKKYVDIEINTEVTVFPNLGNYYVPKKFSKGEKKGQSTYEVRTNLTIHPLTVKQEVELVSFVEEANQENN